MDVAFHFFHLTLDLYKFYLTHLTMRQFSELQMFNSIMNVVQVDICGIFHYG